MPVAEGHSLPFVGPEQIDVSVLESFPYAGPDQEIVTETDEFSLGNRNRRRAILCREAGRQNNEGDQDVTERTHREAFHAGVLLRMGQLAYRLDHIPQHIYSQ